MNCLKSLRCIRHILLLLFGLSVLPAVAFDLDGNGLEDIWETIYFGQTGNDPAADPDGDGFSNLAESNASTHPRNGNHYFQLYAWQTNSRKWLRWRAQYGKKYTIESVHGAGPWETFTVTDANGVTSPLEIPGNGRTIWLDAADPANPIFRGGPTREVWLNTTSLSSIENFKKDYLGWPTGTTPSTIVAVPPDGTQGLGLLKAPTNEGNLYGQRLSGYINAPETGDYTFYIAGRHQCEFWLSTTEDHADLNRVLRLTHNTVLEPEDWTYLERQGYNDQQKSGPVTLQKGDRYYFEVVHTHYGQEDHLAIGWTRPSEPAGTIAVVSGFHISPVIDLTGHNGADFLDADSQCFRIKTCGPDDPDSPDTDGDGLDDGTEFLLGDYSPFDPTSAIASQNDSTTALNALAATSTTVSVRTIDARSTEDTGTTSGGIKRYRDVIRFRVERRGGIRPMGVYYTLGGGDNLLNGNPRDEEDAEPTDYAEVDVNGTPLTGRIVLRAGVNRGEVVIAATPDTVYEYPETVSLNINPHPNYDIDPARERAEAKIYDVPSLAENEILFAGFSVPQPGSVNPKGSAVCSAKLNGNRDRLTLFTSITAGFSAPQSNSHMHKDEGTPGSDPVTFSLPPTGELSEHSWPLWNNGSYTPQDMIDSLFNQVDESTTPGESRLYINWHTMNNPSGELYAFLERANGSVEPPVPGPPPAIAFIDPVTEELALRREIHRFLTQATFGPKQSDIDALYNAIVAEPGQDRMAVYENWIDTQFGSVDQTMVLDHTLASDWMSWSLRGYFDPDNYDPANWGSNGAPTPPINAPPTPAFWPQVAAHNPDTLDYTDHVNFPRPTGEWPMSFAFIESVRRPEDLGFGREERRSNRHGLWAAMVDGHDQLRQRLAFAWSQILIISGQDNSIDRHFYGSARYWDMLAENSDDTFREMLEGVTYSPMMGQYLSLLKNTKEADLDGDGNADVFPDENYAREIMQLFSIAIDNTEWNAPRENTVFTRGGGNFIYGARYEYPMKMFGTQHDTGVKNLPGIVIDNSSLPTEEAIGTADLSDVHDWLAGSGAAPYDGHRSTPAFIARRLIQRLVTSNPPSDYIHRVATRFHDTGGDLNETAKAVLLDYHARSPEIVDNTYGRKKPPLMAYMQFLRSLESSSVLPVADLGNDAGDSTDFGLPAAQRDNYLSGNRFRVPNTDVHLTMSPMRAPSVFNWYLPDYSPGGNIDAASLVAPEFQILNEVSVIRNINYFVAPSLFLYGQGMEALPNQTASGYGANDDHVIPDRSPWISLYEANAGLPEWQRDKLLVDALDELLTGGSLKTTWPLIPADRTPAAGDVVVNDADVNPYEAIIDAITESYSTTASGINGKVRLAHYLIAVSPAFQVQK